MHNLARNYRNMRPSVVISAYDDEGVTPGELAQQQRKDNVELIIERFFAGKNAIQNLEREALARSINPGPDFAERVRQAEALADGGFGPELLAPSNMVEEAFRDYAQTELGAVALARLIAWDNRFIAIGWREANGALTEEGIKAYGEGQWRPLRVASNGHGPDTVTPSGVLVLPDRFFQEYYSTGDIANPLAILHHEIKAHVLPLKEAKGLVPGRDMELICIRLESKMLRELGLPTRRLNWGRDDGTLDHTLHEPSERYFHGLVRYDDDGELVEIEPETERTIGPARVKG
jgi:hypothetical protein